MIGRFARWFAPPQFADNEVKTRNANLLNTILLLMLAFTVVGLVLTLAVSRQNWVSMVIFAGSLIVACVGLLFLMRTGRVRLAAVLLCGILWLAITAMTYVGRQGIHAALISAYFLIVVLAGLLLGGGGVLGFGALALTAMIGIYVIGELGVYQVEVMVRLGPSDLITHSLTLIVVALLLRVAVNQIAATLERARRDEQALLVSNRELQEIRNTLEERVSARTRNLEAVARLSRTITTVLDPLELERQVVNLILEYFDLYYVGLFLVDERGEWTGEPGRWVVLRAGTGEPGRIMVERMHRFRIDDPDSMIARCVQGGQAIIALDVGKEPHRFDNPLLPDTHSEMALPLVSRGQVLGAITIQSSRVAAFSETDIATMQTMADQVAGAIDNARAFATAQQALARSQETIRRYVREAWESYVSTAPVSGYLYAPGRAGPNNQAWLPIMKEALQRRDVAFKVQGEGSTDSELAVPLLFGEQVIGALGLRRESRRGWSREEIELVRDVSLQVAQAVETRRLFEETQRNAQRETALRRTADRVRLQTNLDALLRTAAQEIQRAVGATHVAIRLGTEDTLIGSAQARNAQGGTQDA